MADRTFGPQTTAAEVLAGISLKQKRVLITGGSSGLGAATAEAMAAAGAEVIITARDLDKAHAVVERIRDASGAHVAVEALDLSSLASVRACAERVVQNYGQLDMLINNAGVMACPEMKTQDGFELQFGSNHLGHFLLTNLLVGTLRPGARVVVLSSAAHLITGVDFDDIQFERRPYEKWAAYGQSKTANALFAVGLNARLKSRGVEVFSVHPGMILTDLMRHRSEEDQAVVREQAANGKVKYKSLAAGIATSIYAATAPELKGKGGAYLADCGIAPESMEGMDFTTVRPYALDPVAADRLWEVSEQLVGQKFSWS